MRGCRLISGPRVRLVREPSPGLPKLKRQRNRLNHDAATAARGTSSRSIRSSLRRASRARWSSSTRGTLLFQRSSFMAPSMAHPRDPQSGDGALKYGVRARRPCEPVHTRQFFQPAAPNLAINPDGPSPRPDLARRLGPALKPDLYATVGEKASCELR